MIAAIGKRRIDVLSALQSAAAPMTIAAIAAGLGVHPNTVRFHLERLSADGQVERVEPQQRGPGRPPQMYRAVRRTDPAGPTRYRMLAEILTHGLAAADDPAGRAQEMGRAWGRAAAPQPAGSPIDALVQMLDEFGFAPEPPADGVLRLRHCPFSDLARTRPAVVCPIHLGLMQGALETWRSDLTVDRLDAFVEPDLCLAHVKNGEPR